MRELTSVFDKVMIAISSEEMSALKQVSTESLAIVSKDGKNWLEFTKWIKWLCKGCFSVTTTWFINGCLFIEIEEQKVFVGDIIAFREEFDDFMISANEFCDECGDIHTALCIVLTEGRSYIRNYDN